MRNFRAILGVAVMLLSVSADAQLTLDECQQMASDNYPLLQKYDLVRQTTEYTIKNIQRGYWPQLSLGGQVSYQSEVTDLPDVLSHLLSESSLNYKGMAKDQYQIALDLNQVIWDGGHIKARRDLAASDAEVQVAQADVEMYAIRSRVNELFFGILLLDEKIRLNETLQTLLLDNCRMLETRKMHGTAMESDVDVMRAEYLEARQDLTALRSMRKSYRQMLAIFIGKDTASVINLQKPAASLPQTFDNRRPELNLYAMQMQQTEAQSRLLNVGLRPKLSLFAQGVYGYPGYDMFDSMFDHDLKLNGIVGIRFSWNIGRLYTFKTDKHKLELTRKQIETAREIFLFNNNLQSVREREAVNQYHQMMEEDSDIIRLRTSVRQAAEAKLQHGVIGVNDLLQEITKENRARIDHSLHEMEMLKNIYELKHTINQ
ncbi:MAG TPA: TolC family protein [Candidatus Paraprevotella stercorigallinarum]|nr:TolC family protein [Candidatus Paraprevotella stercorigallinarum]